MAKTADRAQALLEEVWAAAKVRAAREEQALLALARADGIAAIEPWDWRYYAEKVRQRDFSLDEAAIKPYSSSRT